MWNEYFITLDSRHADNNAQPTWKLVEHSINLPANYVLEVVSICFPNAVYPINETNNRVYIVRSSTPLITTTISITPGNYNSASFVAELQNQLDLVYGSNVFTVTYKTTTHTLALTDSAQTFAFVSGLYTMYEEIGFLGTLGKFGATQKCTGPLNISGSKYVDIFSNIPTRNAVSSSNAYHLCRIPLVDNYGYIVYYEPQFQYQSEASNLNFPVLSLVLKDEKQNLWSLPTNTYISLVIRIKQL